MIPNAFFKGKLLEKERRNLLFFSFEILSLQFNKNKVKNEHSHI